MRKLAITAITAWLCCFISPPLISAELQPGEIIVVDFSAGTNFSGAVFRVDPTTGFRRLISDLGGGFPRGTFGTSLGIESSGTILVPAKEFGAFGNPGVLYRIDPARGPTDNKSVVSNFGNPAQGPLGSDTLNGIAIDDLGDALVIDGLGGPSGSGALFRVDTISGARTLLSDFGNPAQGPLGFRPFGITLDFLGNIFVVDRLFRTQNTGLLFAIDPIFGNRTVISDFSNPAEGPLGHEPIGVTLDAEGYILVTDREAGTNNRGLLFRIDPTSGDRVILSDFSDPTQGPLGCGPTGITLNNAGDILVADSGSEACGGIPPSSQGFLFSIDPVTGTRTVISEFGNPAQGPLGENPTGIAIVPQNILEVIIDIRPKSDANKINPNSKGKVAVAIVSTNEFDAANVDLNTVRFGATGTEASPVVIAKRDFDRDKDRDLVLRFEIRETGIECGDTFASLTGQTLDGIPILGSAPIQTVHCRNHKGPRRHLGDKKPHDVKRASHVSMQPGGR